MAGTELRVSELPTAASLDDSDLLLLSQVDANSQTGYASAKTTNVALATKVAKQTNFSDLQTTSKTIIGAINEAAQSGGSDVEVTPILTEGTKIATITVDNVPTDIYGENTKEELEKLSTEKTVTGNPVTFETINGGMAKSCEVTLNPIQDLHGQSAPYPAGGMKNKLPFDLATIKDNNTVGTWSGNNYTYDGVTWTVNDDGTYIVNGTATNDVLLRLIGNSSQSSSTVNLSFPTTDYKITTGLTIDGTNTTYEIGYRPAGSSGATKHIYNNNGYALLSTDINFIQLVVREGYTANNLKFEPMIVPSAESDYTFVPYSNICPISGRDSLHLYQDTEQTETPETTHTATFPDTVYGGIWKVTEGKAIINKAIQTFDGSDDESWSRAGVSDDSLRYYIALSNPIKSGTIGISNYLIYSSTSRGLWGTYNTNSNNFIVKDRGANFESLSTFKTYLSTNNLQFCYELSTPQEITLTAEQIELLKGNNVLWTDGDEIKLTASELANIQDLLTYIQSLEARIKALEEA